ncbi:hypothetical protein Tco_0421048 [Tanacetum coccineum]
MEKITLRRARDVRELHRRSDLVGNKKSIGHFQVIDHMVRMILASVRSPLVWPSITLDGVTRLKEYTKLTPAEAIQADCDIKAINIILQGLPT